MTTFLALYRGKSISAAELVAVSADQEIVRDFGRRLVSDEPKVLELEDEHRRPPRSGNGTAPYKGRRPTKSN